MNSLKYQRRHYWQYCYFNNFSIINKWWLNINSMMIGQKCDWRNFPKFICPNLSISKEKTNTETIGLWEEKFKSVQNDNIRWAPLLTTMILTDASITACETTGPSVGTVLQHTWYFSQSINVYVSFYSSEMWWNRHLALHNSEGVRQLCEVTQYHAPMPSKLSHMW